MHKIGKFSKGIVAATLSLAIVLLVGIIAVSAHVLEDYDALSREYYDYDVEKFECFCYGTYMGYYEDARYASEYSGSMAVGHETNLFMPLLSTDWEAGNAEELEDALVSAESGDTITLTSNIWRTTEISIIGSPARTLTIVTNGFTLNVAVSDDGNNPALRVGTDSALLMDDSGGGYINVSGQNEVVFSHGGTIEVSRVTAREGLCAVHASSGANITVRGNVVNNSISASSRGISSDGESTVTVYGNVTGGGIGVSVSNSVVTVNGNVSTNGNRAISSISRGNITVNGNVTGGATSVHASDSTIMVNGNISTNGTIGVNALSDSDITINGDVSVSNDGNSTGVRASSGSEVTVNGNISVRSVNTASKGAQANTGGEIIVNGTMTAPTFMMVSGRIRTQSQYESPTTRYDFFTYTDGISTVWVRSRNPEVTAVSAAQPVMPYSAGSNVITVDGINLDLLDLTDMRVGAFFNNTGEALYVEAPTVTETRVAATLNFPTNTTGYSRSYTVRVSLDGGATWREVRHTASVMVGIASFAPNPIHYAYLMGYADGTVRPRGNISRAEVSTIFFRLISDESRAEFWLQENPFSDVSLERWYNNAVSTMANAGFIQGYSDGTFRPGAAITRAEFATIVFRFMNLEHTGPNRFSDVRGHWASSAINGIAYVGWARGYADGTFRPNNTITRAEAAAIINRAFLRIPETVDDLLPDMITWSDNSNQNAWYFRDIQEATNAHLHEMKECGIYERWTELIPSRDWTVLQRPDSTPECIIADVDLEE